VENKKFIKMKANREKYGRKYENLEDRKVKLGR